MIVDMIQINKLILVNKLMLLYQQEVIKLILIIVVIKHGL